MKGKALIILVCIAGLAPVQAQNFRFWKYVRNSARMANDSVKVRFENAPGSVVNSILFDTGSSIVEKNVVSIEDGPDSFEGTLRAPAGDTVAFGFKSADTGLAHLLTPCYCGAGITSRSELVLLTEDPSQDEVFGLEFLDILRLYGRQTGERLYFGIYNRGGGFPVSEGFTYFSYMAVISDPEDTTADPTVWGLLYTITQTGIIEPGLYRITGPSTSDLIKLGDITISVTDNDRLLLLSCRIEDLINDAAFSAWYDPLDPVLKAGLMAQKITLTQGAQEADICEGILMYPRTLLIVPETNSLPGLSDPRVRSGTAPRIEITYSDAEQHFPVITEVGFDGDLDVVYPFFPQSLDYSGDVRYHTQAGIPELVSGAWDTARVRFSDNGTDFVEVLVTPETGVVSEQLVPTECTLEANYPNPFNAETIIPFTIDRTQMVDLSIYNVRGVLVERLLHQVLAPGQYRIPWTNRKMHSGIYFIRMQGQGEIHTVKCALIR